MTNNNTSSTETEPVKVSNVYDVTQLKHTLDDELAKYIEKECGYSQSHQHTYLKLVLGYASVLIAGGSFLYERKYGFHYDKFGALGCVISFWVLQAVSLLYTRFVEKNEIFVGYLYHGDEHTGTLSVTSIMDRYSPNYELKYLYTDEKGRKHIRLDITASVASWFTEDGTFLESKFHQHIQSSIQTLPSRLHKD
ncbi:signal peptidase complex subunit 2 [Halteromyces radiatus]|uniref:signal peptidase complex subunit 2 n=1 Tax=Halteromyces radiatus TaxID=101107 RepID=UPI00221FE6BD|nr:signal peptidase complex subunit 2 [Halteromyces radiatus]KAI8096989.1 signal peptidase complex subunit 2 [Halteromyces radiatus]